MAEQPDPRRGLLAEFASEAGIVAAAKALAADGYRELDAFVPRPLEALEEVIAAERSNLPRSVFLGGLFGTFAGLGVQWFCNAWDFPLNVGSRPPFGLPAFIPITFEMLVLFGSLTAFFGVLHRMRLPRLADPIFETPGFERASIDRFFLYVGADDPRFRAGEVEELLRTHGGTNVVWTGHALAPEPSRPEERRVEELGT